MAAEGGEHGGRKAPGAKKYFGAKEAARVFSFRLKTNKRIVESKICSGGVKEEGGAVAHLAGARDCWVDLQRGVLPGHGAATCDLPESMRTTHRAGVT